MFTSPAIPSDGVSNDVMDAVSPKEPFLFGIEFSEEENRRMDEILAEEKDHKC